MKFHPAILVFLTLARASANEALDLLDDTANKAPSVYQESARLAVPQKSTAEKENENLPPPDPKFPQRWKTELAPRFEADLPEGTVVAPRGLFEYQYYDRSIARSARLSRARVGVAIQTHYGLEFLADALLSSSGDYEGWDTLRATLNLTDDYALSLGKFPAPFSTEYSQDAAVRWFPQLSPLVAQIAPASTLGAMLEGRHDTFDWRLGWFSRDTNRSLPDWHGKGFLLASLASTQNKGGTPSSPAAHYQRWHLDYLHNFDDARSQSIPMGYRHLASLGTQYSSGPFDFSTEFLLANGRDQTALGITAAGAYWIVQDAVRLVGRYHYARSREPNGIISGWGIPSTGSDALLPSDFPASTIGGQLSSLYGGLNFHFEDDNLIIGTGVEYRSIAEITDLGDLSSWGWNTFARFAF